jgi:hypothetical protein
MKYSLSIVWGIGLAAGAAGAAVAATTGEQAAGASFAPYQVIIDRAIFGKPPPAKVAPAAEPVPDPAQKQAEALAKKITLKAVNRTPSGNTAVGLVDNDAKPPRILYLNVGDTVDGYTIIAADNDAETATIEKDGVVISLQLGAGLVVAATPPAVAPTLASAAGRSGGSGPGSAPPPAEAPKPGIAINTATEQLLSMVLSMPLGVEVPPLPIVEGDDLAKDSQAALASTIVIENDDPDDIAERKVNIGWAKMDMQAHIQEGGSAVSYLNQLEERRKAEAARQQAARAEAEAKIVELAKKLSDQELQKQRQAINQELIDNAVQPLEDESEEE